MAWLSHHTPPCLPLVLHCKRAPWPPPVQGLIHFQTEPENCSKRQTPLRTSMPCDCPWHQHFILAVHRSL
jgi:hypothetical protein